MGGGERRERRLLTGLRKSLRGVLGVSCEFLGVLLARHGRSVPLLMPVLSRIHRGGGGTCRRRRERVGVQRPA